MIDRIEQMSWKHVFLTWKLANDQEVRAMSRDVARPKIWDHVKWMNRWLNDDQKAVLVAYDGNRSIGIIRMSKDVTGIGEIGISLLKDARGDGNGSMLIRMGVPQLCSLLNVKRVYACMRRNNLASFTAFKRAGFDLEERDDMWMHMYQDL